MGKIRVKAFGNEEEEKKQAEEAKKRKEAKIAESKAQVEEKAEESSVKQSDVESEIKKETESTSDSSKEVNDEKLSEAKSASGGKVKKTKKEKFKDNKAFHSKKYQSLSDLVDKEKIYSLKEGLELLEKLQRTKFDETVELHLNTLTSGLSGNVTLPHGTGKITKVVIANDSVIAEIEKGVINFDILVATPAMMPKLAKVARVLGPKGLMPNPKNGTITEKPEDVAKKYAGGQTNFKTEAKNPLMHLTVGKVSFGTEKLAENIEEMLKAVKKSNIVNVTLKSTMSPGIKIRN